MESLDDLRWSLRSELQSSDETNRSRHWDNERRIERLEGRVSDLETELSGLAETVQKLVNGAETVRKLVNGEGQ